MTVSGIEAWVTSVVEEKDVVKVLILAGSLRRVCTARKLAVMTGPGLCEASCEKLRETFDLVSPIQGKSSNGLNLEDYAKVEAFSLIIFSKCVSLSPNTVVLKNCDQLFEKYENEEFAFSGSYENGLDSSVYLFTPCLEYCKGLGKIASGIAEESNRNGLGIASKHDFDKLFSLWAQNHIPKWGKLDEEYNVHLDLKQGGLPKSLCSKVTISNFGDAHPLDFGCEGDNGWGAIEKFAVELCGSIAEGLEPNTNISPILYKNEPIAIIGLSFRFPGGNNVDELSDLLINGRDAIVDLPETRWTRDRTHKPCENRKIRGGFLSIPVDQFDAKFFKVSGKDSESLDPQHRLLHEVVWEALEDAMVDTSSLRGSKTGIFVGSWLQEYREMLLDCTDPDFFRGYMGTSIGAGAARLAHFFGDDRTHDWDGVGLLIRHCCCGSGL